MVTKIFPAAYVDGIWDVSQAGTLASAGASRDGPGAKTATRSRTLVVSRGTNGACSGDCDRPFRPKVITDSGDRDHAVMRPIGSA